jgi:hypothetical protein
MRGMFRTGLILGFMIGGGAAASHYDKLSGGLLLFFGIAFAIIYDRSLK